jgi:hypothetical protein
MQKDLKGCNSCQSFKKEKNDSTNIIPEYNPSGRAGIPGTGSNSCFNY